jgi:hypothetical protein
MKHWLLSRIINRSREWDNVGENINKTDIAVTIDGGDYLVPANIMSLPLEDRENLIDRYSDKNLYGQLIRQYSRDIMDYSLMQRGDDLIIALSFMPPPMRDHTNSKVIKMSVLEEALDKYQWVGLMTHLTQHTNTQTDILQHSRLVVRDGTELKVLDGDEEYPQQTNVNVITYFIAQRIGNSNAYSLIVNGDMLSISQNIQVRSPERTMFSTNSRQSDVVEYFANPKIEAKKVVDHILVDKDTVTISMFERSGLKVNFNHVVNNMDFEVESSWSYSIDGNNIVLMKQPGVGYVRICFKCSDIMKPYITLQERDSLSLEYLLLGV